MRKSMKKRYIFNLCNIYFFSIGTNSILYKNPNIKTVKLLKYDNTKNEITIEIEKEKNITI